MLRRALAVRAGVAAVVVLLAACSGTTIISEGTLGSPPAQDQPATSTDGDAESSGEPTAEPTADDELDQSDPAEREPSDTEPPGLVGQAQVESLARDCEAGSDPACDILFQVSAAASTEEELARDCGGRGPATDGFCTEGIDSSADGIWFDESSPGLPAVELACREGDATSCDFLYTRSAVGSAYEELGLSCGGRVEVAVPDCRTALADADG